MLARRYEFSDGERIEPFVAALARLLEQREELRPRPTGARSRGWRGRSGSAWASGSGPGGHLARRAASRHRQDRGAGTGSWTRRDSSTTRSRRCSSATCSSAPRRWRRCRGSSGSPRSSARTTSAGTDRAIRSGRAAPRPARELIVAVCDAYRSLMSDRPEARPARGQGAGGCAGGRGHAVRPAGGRLPRRAARRGRDHSLRELPQARRRHRADPRRQPHVERARRLDSLPVLARVAAPAARGAARAATRRAPRSSRPWRAMSRSRPASCGSPTRARGSRRGASAACPTRSARSGRRARSSCSLACPWRLLRRHVGLAAAAGRVPLARAGGAPLGARPRARDRLRRGRGAGGGGSAARHRQARAGRLARQLSAQLRPAQVEPGGPRAS